MTSRPTSHRLPGAMGRISISNARRLWKAGPDARPAGPVHVSMNDYWLPRRRDILPVARAGLRLRRRWPSTGGAVGLWMATFNGGRRQVSVSIWLDPDDLKCFVQSAAHQDVMRTFRETGDLITTTWAMREFDRESSWQQAQDRLMGRVEGVPHH
jgi:hypothetical protein